MPQNRCFSYLKMSVTYYPLSCQEIFSNYVRCWTFQRNLRKLIQLEYKKRFSSSLVSVQQKEIMDSISRKMNHFYPRVSFLIYGVVYCRTCILSQYVARGNYFFIYYGENENCRRPVVHGVSDEDVEGYLDDLLIREFLKYIQSYLEEYTKKIVEKDLEKQEQQLNE